MARDKPHTLVNNKYKIKHLIASAILKENTHKKNEKQNKS